MDPYSITLEFSKKLIEKFDGLIRVVALFGSRARGTEKEKSDIDILIILDDLYNKWDDLVKAYYYKELSELLKDSNFQRIHANTITLSVFWKMIKVGDPLVINILRYGIPVLDTFGMFEALKRMLYEGEIKPSEEAINVIKNRIPHHINLYHYHIAKALESVYWIFVDSAHYLLMSLGYNPPSPDEIPKYLEDLENKKLLDSKYTKWYKAVYDIVHKYAHREIKEISAETVEEWFYRAIDFKNKVERIIKEIKK